MINWVFAMGLCPNKISFVMYSTWSRDVYLMFRVADERFLCVCTVLWSSSVCSQSSKIKLGPGLDLTNRLLIAQASHWSEPCFSKKWSGVTWMAAGDTALWDDCAGYSIRRQSTLPAGILQSYGAKNKWRFCSEGERLLSWDCFSEISISNRLPMRSCCQCIYSLVHPSIKTVYLIYNLLLLQKC